MRHRKVFRRIHLVVGLAAALFLISAGVSGSLLVFRAEVEALLYPELVRVAPGASRVSVDSVMRLVERSVPEAEPPYYVRLPRSATDSYEVWTRGEEGPHVFVDPYRATVLGAVGPTETVTGFLFYWHAELLGGRRGELVVGWSAVLLLVLCASGIVLWWPGRRRWQGFKVKLHASWKRVNYDLHRASGVWTLAFLVLTAVTGASFIFPVAFQSALNRITASPTAAPAPASHPVEAPSAAELESAVRRAAAVLPSGRVTWVYPPTAPTAPITVRMRLPGEMHPNGKTFVYVDRVAGEVLRADAGPRASAGARAFDVLYPLHIGHWGGTAVRVLYVVLGLAPAALAVTGTLVWWNRGRGRRG